MLKHIDYSQPKDCEQLVKLIRSSLHNVLAIYVFGSQINGCANKDSDLDMAVLVEGYADPLDLWDLSSQIAEIVGSPVDLLDMRLASTVMQYQILQTGSILWAKQPDTGLYESFILSEKTALDKARAGILKDIQQRGKIYA